MLTRKNFCGQSSSSQVDSLVCLRVSRQFETQCQKIAGRYCFPTVSEFGECQSKYGLEYQKDGLKLLDLQNRKFRPISVTISQVNWLTKRNLLGRAIGRKAKSVVDATGGLGNDAILLARMGFKVLMIERSPVMSALLEDGLSRLASNADHLSIHHRYGDAKSILPLLDYSPDTIYLDPMYPSGRKQSVKVARSLEVLREIAGDDLDTEELLEIALQSCGRRVVIKRPIYSERMFPDRLSMSLPGRLVRYDIYLAESRQGKTT
jgi:16S rRNA (guanine1516-N2)-methyltransferase